MQNHTNLKIGNEEHRFNYVLGYRDETFFATTPAYVKVGDEVVFKEAENTVHSRLNSWTDVTGEGVRTNLPPSTDRATVRLLIPQHNLSHFATGFKYVLSIITYVAGHPVYLYNGLVDPLSVLALGTGPVRMIGNDYYEYIDIRIIDPFYLMYNDAWRGFREDVCGEASGTNGNGSNLTVVMAAVTDIDGVWTPISGYNVCQSSLSLPIKKDDFLSVNLKDVMTKFTLNICFNSAYNPDNEGFKEYLEETYSLDTDNLHTETMFIIGDNDDIYKGIHHVSQGISVDDVITKQELDIDSWAGWGAGLMASAIVSLVNGEGQVIMDIHSNEIPLTQGRFRYLIKNEIDTVNLDLIDMQNVQINAVNKIVQKVINVERPDDYKANIQKPVFIRTSTSSTIVIHPKVTENLTINLDSYKNKVNAFTLRIGDVMFNEIGRITQGIIFKLGGGLLPEDITDGVYYILDDNNELVTTGKYKVVG